MMPCEAITMTILTTVQLIKPRAVTSYISFHSLINDLSIDISLITVRSVVVWKSDKRSVITLVS